MSKPKRKPNYIVEETGLHSETTLIVIHPFADIDGISECCQTLYDTSLKRVHILRIAENEGGVDNNG